jgi:serine/threonine-protein kinase
MGEVYRARDSKLGREVAVKIVREGLAADPERVLRFEREAKVLASLNHHHIAALYGMEMSADRHFLVMELVEGETLADRLRRGPLSVDETLRIAGQITEALEAAHERGIVHRDLKPANVKITPDEKVKVLDFGLAKAVETDRAGGTSSDSPTLSMMASQAGIILGTAAYMSPEQAKGFPADHRSDVFSFGVVIFEMLTGRQPFQGETAADVLASVLVRDPELSRLPPDLNPRLIEVVRRCLEKSPKRRWQAIGDLRAELEAIAQAPRALPAASQVIVPRPFWRRALPVTLVAIAAGSLAAGAAWYLKPSAPSTVMRFVVEPPDSQRLFPGGRNAIAISPDGQVIVYASGGRLFVRSLQAFDAKPIPMSKSYQVVTSPVFSPDGRSIAFYGVSNEPTIDRINLSGGTPLKLCGADGAAYGISWERDELLFGQTTGGISRVSANGGQPQQVIAVNDGEITNAPQRLPGGQILFAVTKGPGNDRWDNAQIVVQTPGASDRKVVIERGSDPRYLPTGHIVYSVSGTLLAVPFDASRLEPKGGPVPVVEGVRRAAAGVAGSATFSVSGTGSLIYVPGPPFGATASLALTLSDRTGAVETLRIPLGSYDAPRASPDGRQIAVGTTAGQEAIVWVYDLAGTTTLRRLTYGGNNRYPVWARDSARVTFQSDREGDPGLFWQRADGSGGAERLTKPEPGVRHLPESWSPIEDTLLFSSGKGPEFTLWTFSLTTRTATPFGGVHSTNQISASFSPDGRWVAYAGTGNVFVQPYPATGAVYQVFGRGDAGRHAPIWSHDGKEILYNPGPGAFEAVPFFTRPNVNFGAPVDVPRPFETGPPLLRRQYDMTRTGKILGVAVPGQGRATTQSSQINVVLNWFEELKQRVPR